MPSKPCNYICGTFLYELISNRLPPQLVECSPRGPPVGVEVPECTVDSECPSGLACLEERCRNPCYELRPCDASAICSVVDTVPFREAIQ